MPEWRAAGSHQGGCAAVAPPDGLGGTGGNRRPARVVRGGLSGGPPQHPAPPVRNIAATRALCREPSPGSPGRRDSRVDRPSVAPPIRKRVLGPGRGATLGCRLDGRVCTGVPPLCEAAFPRAAHRRIPSGPSPSVSVRGGRPASRERGGGRHGSVPGPASRRSGWRGPRRCAPSRPVDRRWRRSSAPLR